MAMPIKATPVLRGKAATAFLKKVEEGLKKPAPSIEIKNSAQLREIAFALKK